MKDIVTQLRTNSECLAPSIMLAAADEIERLRVERDEARRDWCRLWAAGGPRRQLAPTQAARLRQWDCFKENTDA